VLVCPDNSAVNHRVFVVDITGQLIEHKRPNAALGPTAEAGMNDSEMAKAGGKVSPGDPDPIPIQHRLDKQAMVFGRHPHIADFARQQRCDPLPLILCQCMALDHR